MKFIHREIREVNKMFFLRRKKLRSQFDEKLLTQMALYKSDWHKKTALLKRCVEPSEDIKIDQKISEAKYFYLFSELKNRQINIYSKK